MEEQWRPVIGWETAYEVSSLGQVRRISHSRLKSSAGRIVKQWPSGRAGSGQRLAVWLQLNGASHMRYVHHLVLEAFIGPRPPGLHGLHKDDNRDNNAMANLYWGTRGENMQDAISNGRIPLGSRHRLAKLTEEKVLAILTEHSNGARLCDLAAKNGVSTTAVWRIINGLAWRHVTKMSLRDSPCRNLPSGAV